MVNGIIIGGLLGLVLGFLFGIVYACAIENDAISDHTTDK